MTLPPSDQAPIAYLTGEYPKVSHTFIQREIAAVRAAGITIMTCTVRRAPPKDVLSDQKEEAAATFCILDVARNPFRVVGAHARAFYRSPRRWFSALGLAWQTRSPGARALLWQGFYFIEAGVLADHLQTAKVCHIHNHFGNSSCSVALLASAMSSIPFSFTEHGPAIFFEPKIWALTEKINRAKFVVGISHFCRSQLMLFSDPVHWSKIGIVHCGVDPEAYGRTPRTTSGKRVLFVGRLDPVKGVPLLLEAFARILPVHPDARLTVIGDGPARQDLERYAHGLNLGPAAEFVGYKTQAEVRETLENVDLLVLPSFAEGIPVVLMEAMASRRPVIASRVAGVQELIEDGVAGYVIPPGDVDTLTRRMLEIMENPEMALKMGEAGRKVIESQFNIAHEGAWLADIFRAGKIDGKLRP